MIYIGCVGFTSMVVVGVEFNDCAWYLGLQQLSDKYVYVYCVENVHISSATVIVCA